MSGDRRVIEAMSSPSGEFPSRTREHLAALATGNVLQATTKSVGGRGRSPLDAPDIRMVWSDHRPLDAGASHSANLDHLHRPETLRPAMAIAFFWPTNT